MKNDPLLDAALDRLADKIECGHLLASTDPVAFIEAVILRLDATEDKAEGASDDTAGSD